MKEIEFIAVMVTLILTIFNTRKLFAKTESDTPQEVLDKIAEIKKQAKAIDDLVP